MPNLPADWDEDAKGSRFTRRPAIGVLVGEILDEDLPADGGEGLVRQLVGDWVLDEREQLGSPEVTDSAVGRGADMWIPAIEWAAQAAIGGLIGGFAWAVATATAREARTLIQRLRNRRGVGEEATARFYISRGMAAHLAVDHVAVSDEMLVVELCEEPSSLRGESEHELNYVGIEPWVVMMRNRECTGRYYVVVSAVGDCIASMTTPIEGGERLFSLGHFDE